MVKELPNEDLGRPIGYDPDFHGPLNKRSCTDVVCLLLFLAFVAGWGAVGIWAIKNGDPNTLLAPRDSLGLRCGIDEEVKDLKYLFFFDLTKCLDPSTPFLGCQTPQVCVKQCPQKYFVKSTSNNLSEALDYCRYEQRTYSEANCPLWFLPSQSFLNRCMYNVADRKHTRWKVVASVEGDEISLLKDYLNPVHLWLSLTVHNGISIIKDDQDIHKKRCIPTLTNLDNETIKEIEKLITDNSGNFYALMTNAISNIKLLSEAEQVAEQVIADIISARWKILAGVCLALLACIIYILMLRWIAGVMVWISITGAVVALAAGTYFSYASWRTWKKSYEEEQLSASKTKRDLFLAIFIIVAVVLAIIVLVLIFLRKRIVLAIALIKEGSKAVSSVTSVLFFPIVPWIMQVGVVAYAICVGVFLATSGDPLYHYRNVTDQCSTVSGWKNGAECSPDDFKTNLSKYPNCANVTCKFVEISNEAFYPYLQAVNIFGFFWLAFFVSALGQMVLAQVFAQWYWTMKKKTLPFFALTAAFYRTVRYHLGTLAFGSLIIAICRMIRVCLEYIDRKLKKYDNELTKAILCCLKCFFWCLEKFLKFINKNAYIMCAIHGKNFCGSAKDAFMLLMRNIIRVFVLDKVTDFVFFLSKLLVTAGVGAVAYVFFATDLISFMDNSSLNFGVAPVVIIMIATYLIATLFFNVYSMAVDTLFLCFLEDCERNDGKSKPYYMSRNLMGIFGKKNKGPKYE